MLANPDAPVPFNIAESYQSSGPSYAAFVDIVFDEDDAGFVVERPGEGTGRSRTSKRAILTAKINRTFILRAVIIGIHIIRNGYPLTILTGNATQRSCRAHGVR